MLVTHILQGMAMIKVEKSDPFSSESHRLIEMLSAELAAITGDNGKSNFTVEAMSDDKALWAKRRTRIYYTPEQKTIIWDRYKQGDSLHDIARMFDRYHSSVMPTIHQTGGYRPPVRKRHRLALSLDEREEISRGW